MLFLVIVPCVLCFVYAWRRRRKLLQGKLPPFCGLSWPIIGLAHLWVTGSFWKRLLEIQSDCLKQGFTTLLYAGTSSRYTYFAICDPQDCSKVMNMFLQRSFLLTDCLRAIFGYGLVTAPVSVWKRRRKYLEEAFEQMSFSEELDKQVRYLVEDLEAKAGEGDSSIQVKRSVMRILFLFIFIKSRCEEDFRKHVNLCMDSVEIISDALYVRHKNIFMHNKLIFNLTRSKTKQDEALEILYDVMNKNIKKVTTVANENKVQDDCAEQFTDMQGMADFLLNLQAQKVFTEDDVVKEIITIIFSGYFKIYNTLINILHLLGSHINVQEKIYEELKRLSKNSKQEEDLSRFLYLNGVIMETLRLYPPVSVLSRYIDTEIELTKYKMKSNTNCLVCVYALNRHPIWEDDAEKFKPERWIEGAVPEAFASFGLGERECIGKQFSLMVLKAVLVGLLKEYSIYTCGDDQAEKQHLFFFSQNGRHISLKKRSLPV